MAFLRKILALLLILGLLQPAAYAGYRDFMEADQAFRAAPHDPATINSMLELAMDGNLHASGYLHYFSQENLLTPQQRRAWKGLVQSQRPYVTNELLQCAFQTSKLWLNVAYDPKTLPAGLRVLKKNNVKKNAEELFATIDNLFINGTGHPYFFVYQLATQESFGDRPNVFREAASTYLKKKGGTPGLQLVEAIRLGALEALPYWDTQAVLQDLKKPLSEIIRTSFSQALRLTNWMTEGAQLNSKTTYRDFLTSPQWEGPPSIQLITNGALLGDISLQESLFKNYSARVQELEKELDVKRSLARTSKPASSQVYILSPGGSPSQVRGQGQQGSSSSEIDTLKQGVAIAKEKSELWETLSIAGGSTSVLLNKGEALFHQGGEKRVEARPYFEQIIRNTPRAYEAASAHVRLAALAADEGNLALTHTDAAQALFDDASIFDPTKPTPITKIEGAFLAADRLVHQGELMAAIISWHNQETRYGEKVFLELNRSSQLIFLLLERARSTSSEADIQRALTHLTPQYVATLPKNPPMVLRQVIREIIARCISPSTPLSHLLLQEKETLDQLIQYSMKTDDAHPSTHFHAAHYYYTVHGDGAAYHKHAKTYLTLTSGLGEKQLWDMPSRDFKTYITTKEPGLTVKELELFGTRLNQLGHFYWKGLIPGISKEEADRRAVALFKKAAKVGDYEAMYNLGLAYQEGRGGLEANTEHAIGCLEAARKHNPEDLDVLGHLGNYYQLLSREADTPEDGEQLFAKAMELLQEAEHLGDPAAGINILLAQLNKMHGEGKKLDITPEHMEEKERILRSLLTSLKAMWAHPNPQAVRDSVTTSYILQLICYWGLADLDMIPEWEERLQSKIQELEETSTFTLLEEIKKHQTNPHQKVHKISQVSEEEVSAVEKEDKEDVPPSPAAPLTPMTEDANQAFDDTNEGTSAAAEIAPAITPSVPLTPQLIKKFRALYSGKMSHEQIKNLIKEFDRVNGTNLWRFYRMSHGIHAGSGRRDTYAQKKSRHISAIALFERYANITQEYIDMLTD